MKSATITVIIATALRLAFSIITNFGVMDYYMADIGAKYGLTKAEAFQRVRLFYLSADVVFYGALLFFFITLLRRQNQS